jgi:hypothetical protein
MICAAPQRAGDSHPVFFAMRNKSFYSLLRVEARVPVPIDPAGSA